MTIRLASHRAKTSDAPDDGRFVVFNPNSEVTDAGVANESLPECARPRAQQLASFKPRNIFQPPAHPTLLRPGRPHSDNTEIQLQSSSSRKVA